METSATNEVKTKAELLALKKRLYNPAAAAKIRELVEKNRANRTAFDRKAHEELIKGQPYLALLHLVYEPD